MGIFSSVLKIGGAIIGGIYGGPAGAAAGGAIGGAVGGAVDGDEGEGSSASSIFQSVGSAVPGLIGGIQKQNSDQASQAAILQGQQLSKYAVDQQIAGQRETNAQNLAEAQRNRDYQSFMSNTAHSREIADLKNAGLNPILSVLGGSGASTPSGSMATTQNPYEGMAGDINDSRKISEISRAQLKQEAQRIDNENQRVSNENKLTKSSIDLNKEKSEEARSSAELNKELGYKKILEMDTELLLQGKVAREQEELMSRINLNNATAVRQRAERNYVEKKTQHEDLSLRERDYLSPLKKWTGPAREIFNSTEDAVDIINPFNSRTTIHRYE